MDGRTKEKDGRREMEKGTEAVEERNVVAVRPTDEGREAGRSRERVVKCTKKEDWEIEMELLRAEVGILGLRVSKLELLKAEADKAAEKRGREDKNTERKEGEKEKEEERGGWRPLPDERWWEEKKDRRKRARSILVTGGEVGTGREEVRRMLEIVGGEKVEVDWVRLRVGEDKVKRWPVDMVNGEARARVLEKKDIIREQWKMKVGEDFMTFIRRRTKGVVEARADKERNRGGRVKVEGGWLEVNGSWEMWDERYNKWIGEKAWERRKKEEKRDELRRRSETVEKELEEEGATARRG